MKGLRNELKYVFSSEEKTTIPSRVSSHLYCGHHALCNIATKTLQHKYVHFDVPNRFSTNNTEFLLFGGLKSLFLMQKNVYMLFNMWKKQLLYEGQKQHKRLTTTIRAANNIQIDLFEFTLRSIGAAVVWRFVMRDVSDRVTASPERPPNPETLDRDALTKNYKSCVHMHMYWRMHQRCKDKQNNTTTITNKHCRYY
eukprot:m.150203 g.150203  ORF g.150203 m.150203 type:complete len:197 (-) comp13280_c0_seq14:281-871(-)